MAGFPPTLRDKKRYLVFRVVGERRFSADEVKQAVGSVVLDNLGSFGAAEAGFRFIGFDAARQEGVVRVAVLAVLRVRAALALLANVNKCEAFIQVVRVCGSVKKAESV